MGGKSVRNTRRRAYAKPAVSSQKVFEHTALLCGGDEGGKNRGLSLPCMYFPYS